MKRLILVSLIVFIGCTQQMMSPLSQDSNFTNEDINRSKFNISTSLVNDTFFSAIKDKKTQNHATVGSELSGDSKFSSSDTSSSFESNLSRKKDKIIPIQPKDKK